MCLSQSFLGALALRDVHQNPDRCTFTQHFATHFTNDGGAIFAAQRRLTCKHMPCTEGWKATIGLTLPSFIGAEPASGMASVQLTGRIAQHQLKVAIAALQMLSL